jgi:transposase
MAIVADLFEHVVGIDTHARTHTYCLIHSRTGSVIDTATFPTSKAGNARAISWVLRRTQGSVLAAVEGTSSYGASITAALIEEGLEVAEIRPAPRSTHAHAGKSDDLDAQAAARSVLGCDHDTLAAHVKPAHAPRCGCSWPHGPSSISSALPTATPSPRCFAAPTSTSTLASH